MLKTIGWIIAIIIVFFMVIGRVWASSEPIDLGIIANIESTGHPDAYNRHSGAVGLYQITPICLKDYNKYNKSMLMVDMYKGPMAFIVANWYLNDRIPSLMRSMDIKDTSKNRLWAYNAGIGNIRKGRMPRETRQYIAKYELEERTKGAK